MTHTIFQIIFKISQEVMVGIVNLVLRAVIDSFDNINSSIKKKETDCIMSKTLFEAAQRTQNKKYYYYYYYY